MILGLLFFFAANAAMVLAVHALLARLRVEESPLDLVLLLLFRLLLISVAVLVAGMTGTLSATGLGLAGTAALALLLATGAHRSLKRCPSLFGDKLVAGLFVAIGVRLALQVWFFAPHVGDAVTYHLPKIAEWIQSKGMATRELGFHPSATFPAGFELIETWWVVFLHHDVLIEAAGVEFLLLAGAATSALARQLGFDARTAGLAAIFSILAPGLHLGATSCLNDTPAAALVLAAFALVQGRAPAPLVLMTLGLGVGVKPTVAYALPGIALLALFVGGLPTRPLDSPASSWALAALGLGAGLFWFVRNTIWFGNPIFPIGDPGYPGSPVAVPIGPRLPTFLSNAADLINERVYDRQLPLNANLDHMAGWGPVLFACGLPGAVVLAATHPPFRRMLLVFVVSLLSCLALSDHHPWTLKYVLFFPAILAVAAAQFCRQHRVMAAVAAAGLAFSFLATCLSYDLPAAGAQALASQGWRERCSMDLPAELRQEDRIGACGGYRARTYLLYRADFSRQVAPLRPGSLDELAAALSRSGARTIYFEPSDSTQHDLLRSGVERGYLLPLQGPFYSVHRSLLRKE